MPPRRRNKKVGLKRMDAAVDALFQMGFSKSLVRNTVKNILKVYGGDDGWSFIEEGSYKLVLDTILEEQEKQWVVVQKDESLKDAEAELVSTEPQCVMQVGIEGEGSQELDGQKLLIETTLPSMALSECTPSPVVGVPQQRRRPYYGWITSDDEEDIVYLQTMDDALRRPGVDVGRASNRTRKRRWDVKPEDM